jgi:hypothetical protein
VLVMIDPIISTRTRKMRTNTGSWVDRASTITHHDPSQHRRQAEAERWLAAEAAAGGLVEGEGLVSWALPSLTRSTLTEIYLWHACCWHGIEDGNARTGLLQA